MVRNQLLTALSMAWPNNHTITVGYYVPMTVTHIILSIYLSALVYYNYKVHIDHHQIS